jgi:hypothetical protein
VGVNEHDMAAKAQLLCEAVELEDRAFGMQVVEQLLDEGADPNAVGVYGWRPMEWAVGARNWEAVSRFMDAGARFIVEPSRDLFSFSGLAAEAPEPLIERALKDGARWDDLIEMQYGEETVGENPIVLLLEANHYPRLEWLWGLGLDRLKNTLTSDLPYTPLIHAVLAGDLVGVRWLIGKGVDVNARGEFSNGRTALEDAIGEGNLEMVRALIAAGANPNIPTGMWLTAVDRLLDRIRMAKRGTPEHENAMAMWAMVEPAARRFAKPVYPDGRAVGVWPPGV